MALIVQMMYEASQSIRKGFIGFPLYRCEYREAAWK